MSTIVVVVRGAFVQESSKKCVSNKTSDLADKPTVYTFSDPTTIELRNKWTLPYFSFDPNLSNFSVT